MPNAILNGYSFIKLRRHLFSNGCLSQIINLRYKVFKDAEIGGNAIYIFDKAVKLKSYQLIRIDSENDFKIISPEEISVEDVVNDVEYKIDVDKRFSKIYNKISKLNIKEFGSITKIYQGVITGDNDKYLTDKPINSKWQKIIRGRDINRYSLEFNHIYVFYSPKDLWSNTDIKMFKVKEKIISRQTSDRLIATIDTEGYFSLDSTHVIHLLDDSINLKYLLALFNSTLINFLYQNRVKESGRVFAQVKIVNIKPLPIIIPKQNDDSEQILYKNLIGLTDQILTAKKQLQQAKTESDKTYLQRKCETLDKQIDELVYQLYGLTEEEIKIVEQ